MKKVRMGMVGGGASAFIGTIHRATAAKSKAIKREGEYLRQ
jgi:hypothetical protein